MHDPETTLIRLIECLKPGGWLVLEEPDFSASRGITGDEKTLESVARVNQAIASMYHTLGMDHAVGVKLQAMVQRQGLRNLRTEYDVPLCTGGSGMGR